MPLKHSRQKPAKRCQSNQHITTNVASLFRENNTFYYNTVMTLVYEHWVRVSAIMSAVRARVEWNNRQASAATSPTPVLGA